jgi:hypothetical protein
LVRQKVPGGGLIEQNAPKAEAEPAGRYLPATRFAQQGGIMRIRDAPNLGICALGARRSIATSPPREPRICPAFEKRRLATNLPRRDAAGAGKSR